MDLPGGRTRVDTVPRQTSEGRSTDGKPGGPVSEFEPRLDTLRGLAVVGLAYHADVPGFNGGFVALELFFVVSGYLITGQIVKGVRRGQFSFWEFYTRRVRRLMPAALTTVTGTVLVWTLLLTPVRAAEAANEAAWSVLSLGNFYFWHTADYFQDVATTKPLLILWSLGVEEQWYLCWPLIIVTMLLLFKNKTWMAVVAFIVLGVMLTTFVTAHSQSAAYYMMPTRAYDFALGALCVFIPRPPEKVGIWLMGAGLTIMTLSVALFHEGFNYPSYLALIPCAGAALFIASGTDRPRWFVVSPVLRAVGVRTYSIFLLHYPVLVTIRELNNGQLDWPTRILALVIIAVLSDLQYRFVEMRFRIHRAGEKDPAAVVPGRRRFVRKAAPLIALSVALAAGFAWLGSWLDKPERYPDDLQMVAASTHSSIGVARSQLQKEICAAGRTSPSVCGKLEPGAHNVLVLGDSLGNDGVNIVRATDPSANILVAAIDGCPPYRILDGIEYQTQACPERNALRLPEVAKLAAQVDTIFVSAGVSPERLEGVEDLVTWLTSEGGHVAVLGLGPVFGQYASNVVLSRSRGEADGALWRALLVDEDDNRAAKRAIERSGGVYIDRFATTCRDGQCKALLGDDLVFFDRVHMTRPGAQWLAAQLDIDRSVL